MRQELRDLLSVHGSTLPSFLGLLVICFSTLSGCGGGGGGGNNPGSEGGFIESVTVSGSATKGVIKQAEVNIYQINSGAFGELLASTSTNEVGQFEILLSNLESNAIGIEIIKATDPSLNSRMVCDASQGCGDRMTSDNLDTNQNALIDFGESFALPENFSLRAVTRLDTDHADIHVTPLTHLASVYAERFPLGIHPDSIQIANAQVAEIFSFDQPVDRIRAIDLTNEAETGTSSTELINYALYNAAFLEVFTPNDLHQGINQLADQFAEANGQIKLNSEVLEEVTLSVLAENAAESAARLSFNAAQVKALSLAQKANNAPTNSYSDVSIDQTETQGLTSARNLVHAINEWNQDFNINGESGAFVGSWQSALEDEIKPRSNNILAALAVSSQFGALSALPDLALEAVCNSLNANSAQFICSIILNTNNFRLLCGGGNGGGLLRKDFCDLIEEVPLISNDRIAVTYYFFEERVSVVGNLTDAVKANLEFTAIAPNNANQFGFQVNGWISDEETKITFENSEAIIAFQDQITLSRINLPNHLTFNLNGHLETLDLDNNLTVEGAFVFDLDLTNLSKDIMELDSPNFQEVFAFINEQISEGKGFVGTSTFSGTLNDELDQYFNLDLLFTYGENAHYFNTTAAWPSASGEKTAELNGELNFSETSGMIIRLQEMNLISANSQLTVEVLDEHTLEMRTSQNTVLTLATQGGKPSEGFIRINGLEYASLTNQEEDWLFINYADGSNDQIYLNF